jgi:hypothetical protein
VTGAGIPVSPDWLALREPADAGARSRELIDELPSPDGKWVIHDLACGTGSMGRWLAPLLPGSQRWVLHDRNVDLLRIADADPPAAATEVETRRTDITRLEPGDLAGAGLITASALLDLMTAAELERLIEVCAAVRCPVLLTLSVDGRVELEPSDPLDARLGAAFNAHQRRPVDAGRLLGPDAAEAAAAGFGRRGARVLVRPSPWRLGPGNAGLTAEWLRGWVAAAREQDPSLRAEAGTYLRRRLIEADAGALSATVGHTDLLALP